MHIIQSKKFIVPIFIMNDIFYNNKLIFLFVYKRDQYCQRYKGLAL